jgi:serine/threonine-protein kinase HipA
MRRVRVMMQGRPAGVLEEQTPGRDYRFSYDPGYDGPPVSLTMPVRSDPYLFDRFPPFFDGLLPEGSLLTALLQQMKLDSDDYLGQLLAVGEDPVGAVTIEAMG